MRHVRGGGLIALALALAAGGCKTESNCGGDSDGRGCEQDPDGSTKPTSFESDLTNDAQGGAKGSADASAESGGRNTAAPTAGNPGAAQDAADRDDGGSDSAARAIAEADIIQTQGDRLYALSRIAGLSVIDVSDPGALKLLGRYRELPAQPFEMYLRDGIALVMFSGWGQYTEDQDGNVSWVSTSKLLALDVSDPTNIGLLGSFDVPGEISDSRVVGDVLYVVGYENGYCWRCEKEKPRTSIISLNVANPREVKEVDKLFYDNSNPSWGQRSVTVTTDRMYVAGPEYGQDRPTGSTIQVVDISDEGGDLVEGAAVKVEGQVNSRWQMDEYQGVLRVVSQPQQWWTQDGVQVAKPAIETFKIESSDKLTELGRSDINIPIRDSLRSVRFDGARGYAITAEQKDPLYTLDLSDPAQPRTVGELKIPGFVYHMEPRGDRVLGLGFDNGNPAGSITVSLFDVSDMAKPTELQRVNFGGDWGHLPEDQNRIHKVFKVLDDLNTILVPFSGWSNDTRVDDDCYINDYVGGVQIVDFENDTLKARGAAPSQGGETRRALFAGDKLLAVGDERVQAFDISDRDKPEMISEVVLSRNVVRAVQLESGVVARLSADYRKGSTYELDLVASEDVADPNKSLAKLNLTELATQAQTRCEGSFSMENTFVRGNQLEVLYHSYSYSRTTGTENNRRGLLVIDASDAAKPKLVSNVQWDNDSWQPYYGFYSYGYYGSTSPVVRTDNALALMESTWESTNVSSVQKVRLRVLDLRNLDDVKTTLFPFQAISSFSGLHADGDMVLTSHLESASQDSRRGRFYIDRFDLSDPAAPKQLAKINVPGALMAFDSDSRRAITSEQVRVIVQSQISAEDCYKRFANADWRTDQDLSGGGVTVGVARSGAAPSPTDNPPPVLGQCTGFRQRLNLVHVLDDLAELDDRLELADDKQVFSFSEGDGVVFASVGRGGYYYPRFADIECFGPCGGGSLQPTELLVLGGFDKGELEEGHITVEDEDKNQWYGFWGSPPVYAYGKRALLAGQSDLAIIDASNVTEPKLVKRVPLIGYVQHVEVYEDNALLTFGQQGVQWLPLE